MRPARVGVISENNINPNERKLVMFRRNKQTNQDTVVFERIITDIEGVDGLVDKVKEQVIAWFNSNGAE